MNLFLQNLPWQDIANWIAVVAIPSLLTLWKRKANQASQSGRLLAVVVQGVETAAAALGPDGATVKREIRNQSIDAGVHVELDKAVQKITQP